MKTSFFSDCRSLDEVKRKYKELAMKFHPDKGGSTEIMQQINAEYQNVLKNPFFSVDNTTESDKEEFIKYPDIIDKIILLDGIIIEIIGNWLWITGNTYPHRQILKETGFYFAPKKVMWYYRPADYKSSNKSPKSIDEIRLKYGSDVIENKNKKFELSGS